MIAKRRLPALLTALMILPAAASPGLAAPPAEWLPVRETSLVVAPQSPLDFSALTPNRQIVPDSRLVVSQGRLARADRPDRPEPLLCATLAWGPATGSFPTRADADIYAAQLAMRGYNIARFHFTDGTLMFGRRKDFDFDPEMLDRLHYLLAALKRHGIDWIFDGLTSWRGGLGNHDDRWAPSAGLKLEVHLEEKAYAHWQGLVEALLGRVNPYTGIAPIHDEALAMVVLVNENGMDFETMVRDRRGRPTYPDMLQGPFNRWLKARYGTTQALKAAWPDLGFNERLENSSVRLPRNRWQPHRRMRDLQAFFVETETATTARMTKALRDLGFRGAISNYNNWASIHTAFSRQDLEVVTMNTYHDHVSGYQPGSTIKGESAIADAGKYIRYTAGSRWLGKPFAVTEYDHLFWNPYRYESGLMFPAYAALQGWDAICRHAHAAITLRYGENFDHKRAILPYGIALDPVARAGETLGALLFRRGDVAASGNDIPLLMRGEEDIGDHMQAMEPDHATQFALVSGIGMKKAGELRQPLTINQPRSETDTANLLDELKQAGLLPRSNRTDAARGIFESDTGQLLLDSAARRMSVATPRTEAVAFTALKAPFELATLRIENSDGDGLLSVSVLDDAASLATSKRMLLIFATDARNTGMRFRDRAEKVIEDFGRLPVLIRRGRLAMELKGRSARWRLSPVGLDGTVHPAMASATGPVRFELDNAPASGPTTFFLLETD